MKKVYILAAALMIAGSISVTSCGGSSNQASQSTEQADVNQKGAPAPNKLGGGKLGGKTGDTGKSGSSCGNYDFNQMANYKPQSPEADAAKVAEFLENVYNSVMKKSATAEGAIGSHGQFYQIIEAYAQDQAKYAAFWQALLPQLEAKTSKEFTTLIIAVEATSKDSQDEAEYFYTEVAGNSNFKDPEGISNAFENSYNQVVETFERLEKEQDQGGQQGGGCPNQQGGCPNQQGGGCPNQQ